MRVVDRRAHVLADLSDAADALRVARGAELVAVDGVPVGALLDTMQRYLSVDGRSTAYERYQLGTYWRFHELLALLHGPRAASRVVMRPFRIAGRTVVAGPSLSWLRYAADPSDKVKAFAASPRDFVDRTTDGRWALKPQFDSTRLRTYTPDAAAPRPSHRPRRARRSQSLDAPPSTGRGAASTITYVSTCIRRYVSPLSRHTAMATERQAAGCFRRAGRPHAVIGRTP